MRAELSYLTASVLINAALLYSVDHAATRYQTTVISSQKKAAAKSGPISFEYVESPKVPTRAIPVRSSHISDRDAVNQDNTRVKTITEGPFVKTEGPSDQLAQKQGERPRPSATASPEIAPQRPQEQKKASEQKPENQTPTPAGEGLLNEEKSSPIEKPSQEDSVFRASSPQSRPSPSVPATPTSAARDRITTSEMSKTRSRGAQMEGITSFEATGSGMGVYMKNLKEKIWLAWFPYLVGRYPQDFKTADAVVRFKLNAKGEVKIVELVESNGSPLFAAFCMDSVQRAGPFGTLPAEIVDLVGKDELEIKFAFHYR